MRSAPVNSNGSRLHWCWLLPVLLLVTGLAAQGLNADVIWYDELTSIGHAGGLTGPFSPRQVLDSVSGTSPKHTPLFFELLAGWGALVGWHHAALRSMTLFFGVLSIAWVYRVGKDAFGWRAGLWASGFLGLNVFWLEYFHEIRMYSLQLMLIMALVWHYLRMINTRSRIKRIHWVGLVMTAVLPLYTQPFTIFVHLSIGIYHLLFARFNRRWRQVALAFAAAACLYLPWLPVTLHGLDTKFDTGGDQAMTLDQTLDTFLRLSGNGHWLLILLPLAIAAVQLRKTRSWQSAKPFWILALLVLLLPLLVNEQIGLIPLRRARYFLLVWGLLAVIVGNALAYVGRWPFALLFLALYLAAGFHLRGEDSYLEYQGTISAVHSYPSMHEYVAALQDIVAPQDFVVGFSEGNFVNRKGKHGKSTADYYMEVLLGNDGAFVPTTFSAERLETDIPDKLDNHPFLLFIYDPQGKPDVFTLTETIIQRDYMFCSVALDRPRLRAERYVYRALTCEREYRPIEFDKGISIVDRFIEVHPERQMVRAVTGWEVDDVALLYQYNVSIQIVDTNGEKVAQIDPDRHLYDNILKWYVAELSTSGLLPGDYRVVVIVYDRESGAKISGADLANGEVAKILPIGEFEVEE